ncbi:Macrolide efflux protein A [Halomicronema hongdechloris C2206]|uniref:Macrolide efflux protein A n=1 Tax=Halomicronema hongdechloris C2206 TaxID=1641165 RepID=A0A1Z3HQS6_9CYAN|nr:MFS transporter [Halomicronema hongdechloris]ASC72645.1 Macrolide efflux protein A [Halomicronema hongdechloris C2206]
MRTFLIIWLGQFASLLGSEMTNFAITIWAWEVTGQATPLSFILAVTQVPRLLISLFAGIWVDRFNRKYLMLLGDTVAGLSTVALLALFLTDNLQIWHLYVSGAVNGLFGYLQGLAHSASISLIVPAQHYARASAFESLQMSGSYVVAPALAGTIYAITGLSGILTIDLITFGIAIASLSLASIPQPTAPPHHAAAADTVFHQLTFGIHYLRNHPSLMTLLLFFLISNLIDSASFSILPAMVLARSGDDSTVLGMLFSFFGAGGLLGGLTLSIWGGPKRRIHGVLIAGAVWKVGLMVLALAQQTSVKIGTALVSGFCSPFPSSCSQAIWRAKVEPAFQGRVFATRFLLTQLATPLGAAIAGPLADYVFEPTMQPGGKLTPILGGTFGTGLGAGMALQMSIFALLGIVVAVGGYGIKQLVTVDNAPSPPLAN